MIIIINTVYFVFKWDKKVGKRKNLDFNSRAKEKRPLLIWFGIVVAVFLAGIMSFVVLLAVNDFSFEKLLGARQLTDVESTTDVSEAETSLPASPYTDENALNFLALCVDETDVILCELISVSISENALRIKPVSPDISLEYGGSTLSLQELWQNYSVKAVCEAFETRGSRIDRWVVINEHSFKTMMKNLGEVAVFLEKDVSYVVDSITYTLNAGTRNMTSETLLNYLKFAGQGDELALLQAQAVATVISTHFTVENLEKGEKFFSTLINLVDTNINAFDFNNSYTAIYNFIKNSPEISVIN